MFLFHDDKLYDKWNIKRPLPLLNECIQKRYRDNNYKIVFALYPDKDIFGIDINLGIIFSSGLLVILYYFVNRYGKGEDKKLITTIGVSTILLGIILLLNTFIVPSLGDKNSIIYQELILNNMPILILYPISLIGTLLFSSYTFSELKKENSKRLIKTILTVVGILFADVFVFIYFSYAFIIKFDTSMMITLSNYLVKSIVTVIYLLVVNKMFEVKKVK